MLLVAKYVHEGCLGRLMWRSRVGDAGGAHARTRRKSSAEGMQPSPRTGYIDFEIRTLCGATLSQIPAVSWQ
jgi:hypothetical protein